MVFDQTFIWVSIGELFHPQTVAFALAALGLAIHFGYTGLLNFGQAGFMAVGGYAFAITATHFNAPFIVSLIAAMLGAMVFAILLGIPTLKLRGDYLSIVTIGAAEIIRLTVRTPELQSITGGSTGINQSGNDFFAANPLPQDLTLSLGTIVYNSNQIWVRLVAWICLIIAGFFVWYLMKSPWGRVLKGIREDEDAIRALGKNVFSYKMQALVIGGALAGLGAVFAVIPTSLQPDNYSTQTTFFLWAILLLGGAATIVGPIVGAMIFWFLIAFSEGLIALLMQNNILPITTVQQGQIRYMLVGLALMLLVIYRPQGIFGKKTEAHFNE